MINLKIKKISFCSQQFFYFKVKINDWMWLSNSYAKLVLKWQNCCIWTNDNLDIYYVCKMWINNTRMYRNIYHMSVKISLADANI